MKRLLITALLAGCTTTPLTEDERFDREYAYQQTHERWLVCREAYRQAGQVWHSSFHIDKRRAPERFDMKHDMGQNMCGHVLKVLGYD